jgi:hypothetical protein
LLTKVECVAATDTSNKSLLLAIIRMFGNSLQNPFTENKRSNALI